MSIAQPEEEGVEDAGCVFYCPPSFWRGRGEAEAGEGGDDAMKRLSGSTRATERRNDFAELMEGSWPAVD